MNSEVRLSRRAAADLNGLTRDTQKRIFKRLEAIAEVPFDPRLSKRLTNEGGLRKSRVGG